MKTKKSFHLPDPGDNLLAIVTALHKDQPIETTSEDFSEVNYNEVAYTKTGLWMEQIEKIVGKETMHHIMQQYYKEYSFKHPQPEDFKRVAEEVSSKNLSIIFNKLYQTGFVDSSNLRKQTKLKFILPEFDNKFN